MNFSTFLNRIEEPTPTYSGRGEMALALVVLPLAFLHLLLQGLYGSRAVPGEPWPYLLLHAGFGAVALDSVLLLATPWGGRLIRGLLEQRRLFLLAALPAAYTAIYLLLLRLLGLPQLHSHALAMVKPPWSQLPLLLFLFLSALLLTAGLYAGLRLALRSAAAAAERGFRLRQLGCVAVAVLPYLLLQEHLPLVWCFTTPAAVLVMVYATGLGREYFGFSLVPRSRREFGTVLLLLAAGLSLFLLIASLSGSIRYTGTLWRSGWIAQYNAAFMWLTIVGISEEVIFRCGLLTLIAVWIARKPVAGATDRASFWSRHPRLGAVLLTSVLFGVAHLYRGPLFASLAFIASLLYGLSFVAGKSLSGPVLLHGVLNVLILRNFQL